MEIEKEDHYSTLVHAQSHIWNHTYSFINSLSLKCAVDLGIPDVINNYGQPMPLSKLISSLPIHPTKSRFLRRLMRILVHSGFFHCQQQKKQRVFASNDSQRCSEEVLTGNDNPESAEEEICYLLTESSRLLLKDHPLSLAPFFLFVFELDFTKPWLHLPNWFQNGDPTPFQTAYGVSYWEFTGHVPEWNRVFNESMASDARLVAGVIIEKCRGVFEGLGSLVDVGGGTGTAGKAIAKAFPEMECTVFDLPHVVDGLQGTDNLKFIGGNMFQGIPSADALLLKWILHDWDDEKCVEILKKSKEAITSKVIIIDMILEEDEKADSESLETQLFFDLQMMVLLAGKERNKKEWAKLISSAGFAYYKITPVLGLRSLIELFP